MKKAAILIFALFLFVGLAISQEPQKPVKKADTVKTEKQITPKKDCPKTKTCTEAQKAKCCSHDASKAPKSDPGKK